MITVLRRKKKTHASALQDQFHAAVAAAWLRVTSAMLAFSTSAQSGRAVARQLNIANGEALGCGWRVTSGLLGFLTALAVTNCMGRMGGRCEETQNFTLKPAYIARGAAGVVVCGLDSPSDGMSPTAANVP